jgi:hypothetical protein
MYNIFSCKPKLTKGDTPVIGGISPGCRQTPSLNEQQREFV